VTSQRATHLVCTVEQASEMAAELARDAGAAYSTASLRGGLVLDATATIALGGVPLRSVGLAALHSANVKAAFA
jgi:hypothetical protein